VNMSQQAVVQFLKTALECSVYLAPREFGLTREELFEVGNRAGYQDGEIGDALPAVATAYFGRETTTRLLPQAESLWVIFPLRRDPEYRNFDAFDFLHSQLNALIRAEGKRNAHIERSVLVDRAIAEKIPRLDMEAAITISILCDQLVEKDNILSSKSGRVYEPLPSAQGREHPLANNRDVRERAYSIVKDVVGRRVDGRPRHAEPLDEFPEALDRLGYGPFRLWWIQAVAELRHSNAPTSPVSSLVLAAALVEGSLTFVVTHARKHNLGVFRSSDFDGDPRTWRLDSLIRSAASGGEAAILDESTRFRANCLAMARHRIHAGRMLSDFPSGVPDLRPEEAREGKATAEQVVRRVLSWLEKYPPP
jgi:hypothetical protein